MAQESECQIEAKPLAVVTIIRYIECISHSCRYEKGKRASERMSCGNQTGEEASAAGPARAAHGCAGRAAWIAAAALEGAFPTND
jgi:hypothetical protein